MWLYKSSSNLSGGADGRHQRKGTAIVAVAIDKDKYSQHALKWAVEQLLARGQTVVLLHVNHKISATDANKQQYEKQIRDLFVTFHCFCTRKNIQCIDVILEDNNIPKALAEYVTQAAIEVLVLGASSRHGFIRFKTSDVPSSVMKSAPDFCTIYVISKGKISSAKKSLKPAPFVSPLLEQIQEQSNTTAITSSFSSITPPENGFHVKENLLPPPQKTSEKSRPVLEELESFKSPFTRPGRAENAKLLMLGDLPESETDISFISPTRPSTDDRISVSLDHDLDLSPTATTSSRVSISSNHSFRSGHIGARGSVDLSSSSQAVDEDNEMKRLKMDLMKKMELYSTACKGSLTSKQKAGELQRGRAEEHDHKFKYKRYTINEIEEATEYFAQSRKIGEGGYGPVFKGWLSNTLVAIKVLRPDAAQGRSQFQQESIIPSKSLFSVVYWLIGGGKVSDVGLARLLPPSVADDITQYHMTSTAGTFCYIDPEYQQTGMLGVKSDVYSLGIMLLQMITARSAMGLSHHVENAIEKGTLGQMLDPCVADWPQDEALRFAKLALQCAELRRKDRPDLGKVVLPELARLRDLGEESMPSLMDASDPPESVACSTPA
ncbi:hypothetical protein L1987_75479 [Smallanthus sonchifolius]|uniref:Uncharacterized protein n=1 Tax=Smallanthus sonchifolius TaxID=185202 RepID=A0ACB9A5N4_9ASTR|nr:hypothetical protein L1987_75479 [Smallanthus sonchifolius]